MKIAIVGVKGIPVTYSGFEVLAEEVSILLVAKGCLSTVYCRRGYVNHDGKYKGVERIVLPSIKSKYFETITHSLLSTFHICLKKKHDCVIYLGVGNTFVSLIPRMFGIKTIVNIDGLDWKREKWNVFGSAFLKLSEYASGYLPSKVITDSDYMKRYYFSKYGKNIEFIANGYTKTVQDTSILKKYKLKKDRYIVWIGRLVKDNNIEELIYSFINTKLNMKCVIIGDNTHDQNYKRYVKNICLSDARFTMTGFISHQSALNLLTSSRAYIETKRSGGSHPSLLDAMYSGTVVIANNNIATKEFLGPLGVYYDVNNPINSLTKKLILLKQINNTGDSKLGKNKERVASWNDVANRYYKLLNTYSS